MDGKKVDENGLRDQINTVKSIDNGNNGFGGRIERRAGGRNIKNTLQKAIDGDPDSFSSRGIWPQTSEEG